MPDRNPFPGAATIAGEFARFMSQIHGSVTIGPVQFIESRRCFYAGALYMFGAILSASDKSEDTPESDRRAIIEIDHLWAELQAFQKDVAEGRA